VVVLDQALHQGCHQAWAAECYRQDSDPHQAAAAVGCCRDQVPDRRLECLRGWDGQALLNGGHPTCRHRKVVEACHLGFGCQANRVRHPLVHSHRPESLTRNNKQLRTKATLLHLHNLHNNGSTLLLLLQQLPLFMPAACLTGANLEWMAVAVVLVVVQHRRRRRQRRLRQSQRLVQRPKSVTRRQS